ncbi:ABC transporter permease (plasmid) [Agrobacterium leguminum]|uniref:Xylose transport system permease protein XylH n=1 Tax=Agrobacterium deltaense NCPPB 1641 TaxID=1183425 RepID=A0A1S7UBE9_9HYPH|nr:MULTISPECIES: ABC transporter permease [Agrobacterium]WFS69789.1 ABC transporter permease [Agrobacterium leguminum]CVI64132.1 ABC transporter, permease protein [Agrobacterium deltaense NCPPB 1641]
MGTQTSRPTVSRVAERSVRSPIKRLIMRPEAGAFFAIVIVYIFFAIVTAETRFMSFNGTAAWLNTAAELGIIALAVGLLMIAGELDLSIGAILGASSILMAIGCNLYGVNVWVMILITLAFAAAVGFFNGYVTDRTGLPSFIVTLATNFGVAGAALGLSRLFTNTTSTSMVTSPTADFVFAARWGQANIAIVWWILLTITVAVMLNRTRFGNWIYATGGNLVAARGAGVPTSRVKIILFIGTALAASLVGIIQTIEFHSGNAANGQGYVFQAPIVAVIGGVLLTGGYGSAIGVAFGAALYGIISVGIFYTGWNTDWVQLFLGGLLLGAVLANSYFRKLALTSR